MPYLDDSLLIFTDLDGSLLDHNTYSWQAAAPWLTRLAQHKIPVIITTSKTVAEVTLLQQKLGLSGYPFIAENGSVVCLPESWQRHPDFPRKIFGSDYVHIRAVIGELRQQFDFEFRGFGDVTAAQVADWTGLPVNDAHLAMQREGSEPLVWFGSDGDLRRFEQKLVQEGLTLTRGGRFWHVMGASVSKGAAVAWLTGEYRTQRGHRMTTLGLGDGPNDISMLNAVDRAVVILGHHNHAMALDRHNGDTVFWTRAGGPEGWREGMDHFICC